MAKQRFRDIKQGKAAAREQKKENKLPLEQYASSSLKIKAFLADAFMLVMPIVATSKNTP